MEGSSAASQAYAGPQPGRAQQGGLSLISMSPTSPFPPSTEKGPSWYSTSPQNPRLYKVPESTHLTHPTSCEAQVRPMQHPGAARERPRSLFLFHKQNRNMGHCPAMRRPSRATQIVLANRRIWAGRCPQCCLLGLGLQMADSLSFSTV